jgi:hypothetical protein
MSNRVKAAIPAATLAEVEQKLSEIEVLLATHLETLTIDERKSLPKMGDKSVNFVTKSAEYTSTLAAELPPYIQGADLRIDAAVYAGLLPIFQRLDSLRQQVEDTRMLAGHEGYAEALAVYGALKAAAGQSRPGAQAAVDELKIRFAAQGQRKNK